MSANRTDPNARIEQRLKATKRALDAAVEDMKSAMKRLVRHQARVVRLEAALKTPVAERRARAARALETRRQVPTHRRRTIRFSEEGT